MEELLVLLMPRRSSMSLLGDATSTSMLSRDSETECLCEELDEGACERFRSE
jgi:hypothetical protein